MTTVWGKDTRNPCKTNIISNRRFRLALRSFFDSPTAARIFFRILITFKPATMYMRTMATMKQGWMPMSTIRLCKTAPGDTEIVKIRHPVVVETVSAYCSRNAQIAGQRERSYHGVMAAHAFERVELKTNRTVYYNMTWAKSRWRLVTLTKSHAPQLPLIRGRGLSKTGQWEIRYRTPTLSCAFVYSRAVTRSTAM